MPKARKISTLRGTFRDEWVAAAVTKVDKADVPMAGVLLTHSPDKRQVYGTVKAYLAEHPAARVFIFFAGDPIPEGVGVALALRSSDQGTLRLRRGAAGARQGPGTGC